VRTLSPVSTGAMPMEMREHHVNVVVDNGFARTEVSQTFYNPNAAAEDAVYEFPVPKDAALSEMSIENGDKTLHGEVVGADQAQTIYDQQKATGAQAGLATQNGYQTFRFQLARLDFDFGRAYYGQQLVVFGQYDAAGRAQMTLEGTLSGKPKQYATSFDFPATAAENPELEPCLRRSRALRRRRHERRHEQRFGQFWRRAGSRDGAVRRAPRTVRPRPQTPRGAGVIRARGLLEPSTWRVPVLSTSLTLAAFAIDRFEWDLAMRREEVLRGELYRLVTGHLCHFNRAHLLGDALAFAVWAAWAEQRGRGLLASTLLFTALGSSVIFLAFCPEVGEYRGLSAVDSALVAQLIACGVAEKWRARDAAGATLFALAGFVFLGKTLFEFYTGHAALASHLGDQVTLLPISRLAGIAIGLACLVAATISEGACVRFPRGGRPPGMLRHGRWMKPPGPQCLRRWRLWTSRRTVRLATSASSHARCAFAPPCRGWTTAPAWWWYSIPASASTRLARHVSRASGSCDRVWRWRGMPGTEKPLAPRGCPTARRCCIPAREPASSTS
jgi:membrane associated rhomboid family serine protease